jgi:hypothetical protein
VHILDRNRTDAQWRVNKLSDGKFTLSAVRTNRLLNLEGGSLGFGLGVTVTGEAPSDDATRSISENGEGNFTLNQGPLTSRIVAAAT